MSNALPNCEVCGHLDEIEVNGQMRGGTSVARISRFLRSRWARMTPAQREKTTLISAYQLREHLAICFREIEASRAEKASRYIRASDIETPGRAQPISVSAAELADPTRRLDLIREALAQKLGDLSAEKLYGMYMAELKLQTAEAERAKVPETPETPDEGDGLDTAMGQAAGHRPDLRVVSSRGKVARR